MAVWLAPNQHVTSHPKIRNQLVANKRVALEFLDLTKPYKTGTKKDEPKEKKTTDCMRMSPTFSNVIFCLVWVWMTKKWQNLGYMLSSWLANSSLTCCSVKATEPQPFASFAAVNLSRFLKLQPVYHVFTSCYGRLPK